MSNCLAMADCDIYETQPKFIVIGKTVTVLMNKFERLAQKNNNLNFVYFLTSNNCKLTIKT